MYDEKFMARAIEISREALGKPGTEPFGCVIVRDGEIVGEGLNHSKANFDPTSHGEVEAIRDACRKLETVDLSGCDLYTSCEPCSLCVATMNITGIANLYYAASMQQAGDAFQGITRKHRHPIDVDVMISEIGKPVQTRKMPAAQKLDGPAVAILEAWASTRKS